MSMEKKIANRYMIVTPLGEGGMADVYLAIDTILNREVAIKILRGDLSHDPLALLRFQREANAASRLHHPNVVEVYDVGESEGKHYIVMEYVRGRTLKQLLAQRGALHKEEAVNIMKQLTSAVAEANANNIIHRDIKPQNIMVKDDGTVKITDFGISLAHDVVQLTASDSVLGSAHYLAPETTRGETATNQIDIYALGIVFYEILCGDVPYKGDNPVSIAMKHTQEEIPSIKDFNPTLPQSIENIIIKATAKNRNNRYLNASEMLDDLKQCLRPENADVDKLVFESINEYDKTLVITSLNNGNITSDENDQENEAVEGNNPLVKKIIIGIGVALSIVSVLAILYFSGIFGIGGDDDLVIPKIVGSKLDDALTELEYNEIKVETKYKYELSDKYSENTVIDVYPKEGSKISSDKKVTLTISSGKYYKIKDYVGQNIDEVKAKFSNDSVNINVIIETRVDKTQKAGTILEQSILKAGSKINPKKYTQIKFVVAASPEFVIDPSLLGMDIKTAQEMLNKLGAKVELKELDPNAMTSEEIKTVKVNTVVKISPSVNTLYIQEENNSIILFYYSSIPKVDDGQVDNPNGSENE